MANRWGRLFVLTILTGVCALFVTASADDNFDRLVRAQKYSEAVAYADDKMPSNTRTAEVWVKVGTANEALGLNEKALACYFVGSRMDPKNYEAYLGISRIYNKLNQPDNALTYAQKALDLQQTGEASWEYARACMALKRPKDAKSALEKVIDSDRNNAAACRGLADLYWEEKEYKKAIPLLKVAYASKPNAEDAMKIGRALVQANRPDSAIFYLKDAITRNPNLLNANLELARAYYQKDKFLAAANEFEKIAGKVKLTADDQYCSAVSQEKTGSMESALRAYQAAADAFGTTSSPAAITSHLKAGKNDLEKKNFESALVHFRAIAVADSDSHVVPDINFMIADAYTGAGNNPKAIASLEKALASDKNNVEAYARLADLYQKSGNPDKAKQIFEKITTLSPNDPKIYLTLGDYNLKAKKYSDALKYFEKSFILDKSAPAAAGMSQAAAALDMWDKAIDAAESAIRFDPSILEPRIVLSKGFLRNNQYKDAKEQLDFLVAKKPFEIEYLKQLAYCYKQLGDATNLSYVDKKIVEQDKNNIESRMRLAKYLLAQREYKQSFDLYKELAVLTPQNVDVYKSLYEITNNSGDKTAASGYLKKYLSMSPADPVAQRNLGNLYYEQKNFDAALAAYRTAIKLDPTIKGVYKPYAEIVVAKGLKEELHAALSGAVAANEADAGMYATLGSVYQKQGQCPKAIDLYQKALAMDPKNNAVLSGLAQCQATTGNIDAATISYEQVVALNTSAVEEYRMLGDLYLKKNREADAAMVYKKYLDKKSGDSKIARIVGEYAFKQKNYEEANRYFSMISGEETKKTDFLMHFGQACYFAKNYRKAAAVLSQLAILTPQNPDVFKLLFSVVQQDSALMKDAPGYLKKYTALKPSDAQAHKSLGDMLYDQKDMSGALAAYRQALAIDPTIKGIYKRYFDIASARGVPADIAQALNGAINAGEADAAMYSAQGNNFQKQGSCPKAIQMYQKALALDPKNAGVLLAMAACQMKTGNLQEASITYEQVLAFSPNDNRLYKSLGDCYMSLNKKDAALNVYKKYLEKEPKDYAVALVVGEREYATKDYGEAVRYLSMITGDEARKASFISMLAQSYYQTKEYAKAKVLYKQLSVLTPQDALIEKTLYDLCMRDGEKEEAISHVKRYAALKPADAQAQRDLGDMLYERKEMNGAFVAYRTALAADPAIKGIYKRYGEIVMSRGNPEEELAVFSAAVNAGEADGAMYATLGSIYEKKSMCPKAIQMFQKALSYDSKNTAVLISLASCQMKTGNTTDASITYEQVLALSPQDLRINKMLGDMYMQQHKTDQAIATYKKYLEKQPKDYTVALEVAEYAYKKKDYDDAAQYFGMVSGEESKKSSFISQYAFACYQKRNYDKAKDLYKQLALLTPQNADIYQTLYDICMKSNDKEGALSYLRKYASLKPHDAGAHRDLADYLYEQKDMSGALAAYRAAATADPSIKGIYKRYCELVATRGTPEEVQKVLGAAVSCGEADANTYITLGTIFEKKSLYPKAISYYNKGLQLDQRNTQVLSSLARCLLKAGNVSDAIVTYQQVVAVNPDATAEYKILGDLYMKQNKQDEAMDAYKKYSAKAPDDPSTAMYLAEEAYKNKDYDGTIKYLSKVQKEKGSDPEFLYLLGRAYYNGKNYKKTIEIFEHLRAVSREQRQKNPHLPLMLRMLADSYDKSGDNANAVNAYTAYTKLPEVKDPEASYRKAQIAESVNPAMAAKMYEENAQDFPKDYRNYYNAGMMYAKQPATLEKAVAMIRKFLSMKDTLPTLWIEMGHIYGKMGKLKQEIDSYQQYIQRDASNPDACEEIGVTLLDKRMANDAMVFLEMANALKANEPDFMYQLSRGYVKTDRLADAMPLLEKAEKLKPNDDKIQNLYNFVLQRAGKSQKSDTNPKNDAW
jgi:tetratricopeptide (TPR) repeat protein